MKISSITLAILVFLTFSSFAQNGMIDDDGWARRFLANYVTSFYNTESNGFPSNESNTVVQTKDGFLWFGGFSGLVRYDGRKYTQWDAVSSSNTKDNFTSSSVRHLYESKNGGTLWIATNDKGLFSYKNGNFTVYDKAKGTPSNMVRCITEREDGMIFCGTSDGLFYIDKMNNIITVDLNIEIQPFIISITADTQNNIFMILNTGELVVYTRDGRTIQSPFGSNFHCVGFTSTKRVLAGTQDGKVYIAEFNGNNFNDPIIRQTPNENISSFYEDSNGSIWITSETGLGFLNTWLYYYHIGNPNGVGFYSGVIEDYQNGYWITATKGGIVKLSASAFTDFNALYNFQTGSANAVVIDNGKFYIGTDNTLYILDENGNPIFTNFCKLISGRVRGIFRDSRGYIWICTYSSMGTIRFDPISGEYKSFTSADGLASDRSRSFAELPNGVVAVGTATGVSFIKDDKVISTEEAFGASIPLNLPVITILSMCVTADGTLYIGTDGIGVYTVNKNGIKHFGEEEGLTGGVILRLFANQKANGVWVSPSNGLCYIEENKTARVIEKVPSYSLLDIMQYNNELIFLTRPFVVRTDADALLDPDIPFEHITVGRTAGLSVDINPNAWNWITDDNKLYFCYETGISIFDFESTHSAVVPFAGITKIDIDGREYVDFSETIQLGRNTYRLTVELSYLSFGLLDNAEMHYMLAGQDNSEYTISKTGNLDVSYTNLKGGNYLFRVWTEDPNGIKGNTIEINLHKKYKLLELPMVWVGIVLLGFSAIALIFYLVYRQRMREQRLAMENAALDRINSFKTDLMRSISHEMRTPLAVITGFAEITAENDRKKYPNSETAQNLDAIANEAKRMADMMEEMRHLALAKEYSKGRHPVDIGSVINQIARLYAKVLERKDIKLMLNIADNLPFVYANESELTQVIFNLLRNAEKHTAEGTITIIAENIIDEDHGAGSFVKLAVCDTGMGIKPDLLPHVFERGVHGEEGGTGFGLAICRDIVTAYDGKIGIESVPGEGTTVSILLPVNDTPPDNF